MPKIKLKKSYGVRPMLLVGLLLVIAVGAGTFLWNQQQSGAKAENSNITPRENLNGTVSRFDIPEWGIKLNFKDADKVKYNVTEAAGNHLELRARGVLLPADKCDRLGIALNRSKTKNPAYDNAHVGNYYYYFTSTSSYCHTNKPDDPQTTDLKQKLVSQSFGRGAYTITAL